MCAIFIINYRLMENDMFIPKCTPCRVGGFSVSIPIYLPELVKQRKMTKDGEVVKVSLESVNQSKELPDSSTTDLSVLLAAGKSPDVVRAPMFGKSEADYSQLVSNILEQEKKPSSQNSQQTNSQNPQQTNTNKGE